MRHRLALALTVAGVAACSSSGDREPQLADACPPPSRTSAVETIFDAFDDHTAVYIGEQHGSTAQHEVIERFVCDERFAEVVDAVVVEFGNSRLQAIVDDYVDGGDVSERRLASVWQETTQRSGVWDAPVYRRFYELIRSVNGALPDADRVRVVAGDPPVDMDEIVETVDCDTDDPTCLDHWLFRRETSFAAAVGAVLDGGGRCLVILGEGHVTPRREPAAPSSVPELVEGSHPGATAVLLGRELVG